MSSKESPAIGRTVVVGVDGSPGATDAAVLGRRLAEAAGGSVHLVTAALQVLVEVAATRPTSLLIVPSSAPSPPTDGDVVFD